MKANKYITLPSAALFLVLLVLSGCQSTGRPRGFVTPPGWVEGDPEVEGMICAVGASEPTFFLEDAKKYAAGHARKALASSLSIEVNSIMVDITTEKSANVSEASVMQISSWATTAVVRDSKIMQYWFDEKGVVSPKKNMTYALSCMPRKFDRVDLHQRLIRSHLSGDYDEIGITVDTIINRLTEEQVR